MTLLLVSLVFFFQFIAQLAIRKRTSRINSDSRQSSSSVIILINKYPHEDSCDRDLDDRYRDIRGALLRRDSRMFVFVLTVAHVCTYRRRLFSDTVSYNYRNT